MGEVWSVPHVRPFAPAFPQLPTSALSCLAKVRWRDDPHPLQPGNLSSISTHVAMCLPVALSSLGLGRFGVSDWHFYCFLCSVSSHPCSSALLLPQQSSGTSPSPSAPPRTPLQLRKQRRGTKMGGGSNRGGTAEVQRFLAEPPVQATSGGWDRPLQSQQQIEQGFTAGQMSA